MVKFPSAQHIIRYTAGIVELDELLSTLVNDVDGALGAAIGGMDGLLIEQYAADSSLNLDTIIAEHANILKSVNGGRWSSSGWRGRPPLIKRSPQTPGTSGSNESWMSSTWWILVWEPAVW